MVKNLSFKYLLRSAALIWIFFSINPVFAKEKSIFSLEKPREGDFENVTVEPDSIDLKNYINQTLEAIRLKNEKILEFNKKTSETVFDLNKNTKESVEEQKDKIRDFLGIKKSEGKESSHVIQDPENKTPEIELKVLNESELKEIELENNSIASRQVFVNYCLDNLRGYPYVSGGSSPKTGFDCSGVVQYAAKQSLGIKLPRTAQAMYNYSEKVSSDEVLPGDLIFFSAGGKISHVGVYLGTDGAEDSFKGKIIFFNSASEPKYRSGTIISSLSEPYWKRHFYSYGRFIH